MAAAPKPGLLGNYEEHAPVQAVYVGSRVDGSLTTGNADNYRVQPGMLLFVRNVNSDTVPKVIANTGDNDAHGELAVFGVAHDPVLDGRIAMANPGAADVVSTIVAGAVTVLADCPECRVGDTIYVRADGKGRKYQDMAWYTPPKFTTTAEANTTKLGTVIEVYPDTDGVLRIQLCIVGQKGNLPVQMPGESIDSITVAPQQPVYVQTRLKQCHEGRLYYSGSSVRSQVDGDEYFECTQGTEVEVRNLANGNATEVLVGIGCDNIPNENGDDYIPGVLMVAGTASVLMGTSAEGSPVKLPINANVGDRFRVVGRSDDTNEHYVCLHTGGRTFKETEPVVVVPAVSGGAPVASSSGGAAASSPAQTRGGAPKQKKPKLRVGVIGE